MRCKYCHNPDTWKLPGDDYDNLKTPEELLKQAKRYKSYWGKTGGITVSGGEALLQIDFLYRIFSLQSRTKFIQHSIPPEIRLQESRSFSTSSMNFLKYTDLFMLDIKHIDDEEHKNFGILQIKIYLIWLSIFRSREKDMWIRHVLVPGINDDEKILKKTL